MTMQQRSNPAVALAKYVKSRLELIRCFQNTGASTGDERYDRLLVDTESAVANQLQKIPALGCGMPST